MVNFPSEKSILPYFSSPRGVAISVPFPEVQSQKGTESGLEEEEKEEKEEEEEEDNNNDNNKEEEEDNNNNNNNDKDG